MIELNSDLQLTAGYLEQIIPTLAFNITDAFSIQNMAEASVSANPKITSNKRVHINHTSKRRRFSTVKQANSDETKLGVDVNLENAKTAASCTATNSFDHEFSSLYSILYLNYSQYTTKAIQFNRNEHQYRELCLGRQILEQKGDSSVKMLARLSIYLRMLEKTAHKRLASACFHSLGALASNSEDARRQITENSSLISRLVESLQVNLNRAKQEDECDNELKNELEEEDESDECEEEEDDLSYSKITEFLSEIKGELVGEQLLQEGSEDESAEQFLTSLEEDFDDLNESDSDLLRLSGLCLMHSLSRSVHQLRTKFLDKRIWTPIVELIKRCRRRRLDKQTLIRKYRRLRSIQTEQEMIQTNEVLPMDADNQSDQQQEEFSCEGGLNEQNLLSVTTAILANLLLEFSPSKKVILNYFECK